MSSRPTVLVGLLGLGLTITGLALTTAAPAANAASSGLVISEVYGGGGNTGAPWTNDFIEIYNPTGSAISVNGWSVQARSATSTSAASVTPLSGSVPAGGYYLVQEGAGTTVTNKPLPTPDATGTIGMGAAGWQVWLATTTSAQNPPAGSLNYANFPAVVDMVGAATNSTTFEGATANEAPSNTLSTYRTAGDTDNNANDFNVAAPTPTNSASPAAPLTVTDPGAKSGVVGEAITPFTMAATGGTSPYTWVATGLPTGVSINATTGQVAGTPSATCTCTVTVTATDSAGSPATDDQVFTFTVTSNVTVTPIAEIQGTSNNSPMVGTTVTTEGVVTGMYRDPAFANSSYDGMYIQTAGTGGATDTTPNASDAIFVFGPDSMPAGVQVGDSVRVTGPVSEAFGTTEITPGVDGVQEIAPLAAVSGRQIAYPTTEVAREAQEGMLLAPTDTFTVTNSFNTNAFAEVGLATGDQPLVQPTEVYRDDAAELQTVKDDNLVRGVILDDGTSVNYMSNSAAKDQPLPWLTGAGGGGNPIRVGAEVTLHQPVVFENRFGTWRFQPQTPVFGNGDAVATFENTRTANTAPQPVGGDLQIATFNVLNYFNTTGEAYDALPNTVCTYFTDRAGNRIGNNQCGTPAASNGNGPRGAATQVSFERQQAKIVNAINTLDADIVGLEEVENSMKLLGETNRDDALSALVAALNAAAGRNKWAYVKSPGEALATAAISEQDVIRPAFIYQRASVAPVGSSDILFGTTEFANAREPLAQAFKPADAPDSEAFAVIVNHFKSKGDSSPPATGDNANSADVGAFNGDRTRQATRLAQFAQEFADARGIEAIFLAGDFNSYTHEDPMHALYDAGFDAIDSDDATDETYSFGGLSGSLDHFLGNDAAVAMVSGADVWEINADESVAFQYSRFNYNVTQFFDASNPFAASDHNPEIVGIDLPAYTPDTTTKVQILGTNDFHGRLLANGQEGGAAVLSGAVHELRDQYPNTVFAAAGDLVGASTFESFIQHDEPTIDALNAAGLEVSAAGNHEFDQGYEDFVGRIQDHAAWEYIAANVNEPPGRDELAESWTRDFGDIKVGFVGAVTEDLPSLVSPDGIQGVSVTDIVDATNAAATDLKTAGADIVVLLVHEGSPSTNCSSANFTDESTVWGNITQNVSADVDAIISGHTHLAYDCSFTVQDWVDDGRAVTKRPVVSAGQYGTNLNQLIFSVDDATDEVVATSQDVIGLGGSGWTPDPAVTAIVNDAVAQANTLGARVLGEIQGPFNRAKLANAAENRGGESTLGNLVAEVQRWATSTPEAGAAQIAFMNPGGLRADMTGTLNGSVRELTYKQAAVVQPFANTLVNMDLTGAQIETALEQQWQRTSTGTVPSRPFLRLGVSKGFTYTYVETPVTVNGVDTFRGEVSGMWLDGVPIDPTASYSVTVNSFLGSGGDNFFEFANGAGKADTGKVDLEAMVDYMEAFGPSGSPLPVDYRQRAVEVEFPADAPEVYGPGDTVVFDVASWTMSTADDIKDAQIRVMLGDDQLGTATLNNTIGTTPYDQYGTASVSVTLPAAIADGDHELTLVGQQTGTEVPVVIQTQDGITDVQILGTNDFHGRILQTAANREGGAAVLSGAVKQLRGNNPNTVFTAAGDLIGASTFESFIQHDEPTIDALNEAGLEVSAAGNHEFDQGYEDLVGRVQTRADWEYIAANVEEPAGRDDLAETWTKDFGAVEVGFVGAVTEELPSLVSPAGIEGVTVTDIVDATNAAAADLKAGGADVVVLLVHEGAPSTDCTSSAFTNPATTWGNITQNVSPDVDAIISGHTHLAYNCEFPVQAWVDGGRAVTERPVVSAGQYGMNLNQLVFTVDDATGDVEGLSTAVLPLMTPDPDGSGPGLPTALYPADPAVTSIVNDAVAQAEVLGAQVLGQIQAPFNRARLANGTTENRGGESTLGNLVAEVQRWATDTPETGSAQIAFMNPGGLRQDMAGTLNGGARDVTYKQAAVVQPFANTLVNMDLTGAQIETVLEQQWQRDAAGNVPTRPFLRLGVSKGFTYTYQETPATVNGTATFQGEITGMWLDGDPIDPAATYSVTVNSFLASGGDNFRELTNGTGRADTGKVDLEAMVDYLDEFGPVGTPLPVDYSQRAVEVHNVADLYTIGGNLTFDVASWTMSTTADVKDSQIRVMLGDTELGTATLDNAIGAIAYDAYGAAHVNVALPPGTPVGRTTVTLVGASTGTEVKVPIAIQRASSTVTGSDVTMAYGRSATMEVTVSGDGVVPTGSVSLKSGGTSLGSGVLLGGVATATIAAKKLAVGTHEVTISYPGDGSVKPGTDTATVTVIKATPTVVRSRTTVEYGNAAVVPVRVTAPGVVPSGTVTLSVGGTEIGTGTLSNGSVDVDIAARSLPPQTTAYQVDVSYSGDDHVADGTGTVVLVVQKATPSVTGDDATMTYGHTGSMHVTVTTATGVVPTGRVVLSTNGITLGAGNLTDGEVTVTILRNKVPASATPYDVTVRYVGDASVKAGTDIAQLTVNP